MQRRSTLALTRHCIPTELSPLRTEIRPWSGDAWLFDDEAGFGARIEANGAVVAFDDVAHDR
jgi:hypothetical protein